MVASPVWKIILDGIAFLTFKSKYNSSIGKQLERFLVFFFSCYSKDMVLLTNYVWS